MADDKTPNNGGNAGDTGSAGGNSGDTGNAGGTKGDTGAGEIMIPKSRLDEETTKRRDLEKWKSEREQADQEAEKKRLEEQGKFKELADKEKARADELEVKYQNTAKLNALKLEAIKNGTVDADAIVALTKLEDIKLSEDGSVDTTSVTAIIENLKANKKYLFGEGSKDNTNIGASGGAPNGGSNTTPTFKRSQLSDPKFYKENRDAILQAQREGKIVDDVTPKSP